METTPTKNARLNLLIEQAASIAGSEYKVAKMLGMPQQVISDWKAGRRTCGPEDRARLAGIAGVNPVEELVRATLEKTEGTKRGDDLRHLLGKSLLAIGAAVASSGASAAAIFSTTQGLPGLDALMMLLSTMYTSVKRRTERLAIAYQ